MNHKILFLFFFLITQLSFAQKGTVRGTVIDANNAEALFGVTVVVKGTTTGTVTDFDGKFDLKLDPGTYDLQVSMVSFATMVIEGVVVESDKVNVIENIGLGEDVAVLSEVVVSAKAIKETEEAILTMKKKSPALMDGISAANFRKMGDGDAASAIKRVTGVSVEGGKYVYVRGLGDRYTKTTLNIVDIPGLDPDRNSLQMDIFPTDLIGNMTVNKTFIADMPADFTGGIVNIETTDFPDSKVLNVSFGIGYNPAMHMNKNYIASETGSTDFLGFDDGTRGLPEEARRDKIPSPLSRDSPEDVNKFLKEFNPNLGVENKTSFMDYDFGISTANQFNLGIKDWKLGYIFSTTYKSTTKFYDDVIYGEYQRNIDPSIYEMTYATTQKGQIGERNVLLGGLGGLALKTDKSKYRLTAMHLQNGESRAGKFAIDNNSDAIGQSGYFAQSENLEYNQRGLTNILLNGTHYMDGDKWELDWRISPTFSRLEDPDIRKTAFTQTSVDTLFAAGAGGNPSRIWRNLNEINLVNKIDITRKILLFGENAKLKFGVSHVYKQRDYEILAYELQFFGAQSWGPNVSPSDVLDPNNLYPNNPNSIYYQSANNNPNPNSYNSNVSNTGVYISSEFNPLVRLKAILGVRAENFVQRHTGRDALYAQGDPSGNNLDNEKVLNSLDLFPSANLIYSLTPDQNLRVAFSKTIARPSFKELSFAQIIDPITNRIFNGGLFSYNNWDGKLSETRIDNLDLRWELFLPKGQIISVSGFYKFFRDPIELVRIPEQQTSTEFQPRNVGDGQVFGAEFELRKNFEFVSSRLSSFNFNFNLTVVESQIKITDTEFNSRKQYEKENETISKTRNMAGQAPYIINSGISYSNNEKGLEAGAYYNVKGSTLIIVGGGLFPDVYMEPFHSLNFKVNKTLGKEKRTSIDFKVSNILNDAREEVYKSVNANDQYFSRFLPSTTYSVGVKYNFF